MDYSEYYSNMPRLNSSQNNNNTIYNNRQIINNFTNIIPENPIKSYINKKEGKNVYSLISVQDIQDIIYTRIIVSSIGSFLCVICIILYIIIFIKKRCMRTKSILGGKANNLKKLNSIDNKLEEKLLSDKSNNGVSEDESQGNKIRISDLNNTTNYFRNSSSNYYDNRLSNDTYMNYINNNKDLNNHEKTKNPFFVKDGISIVPTVSTLDHQRKTANTIAIEHIRNLLSKVEKDKDQAYYRLSEPAFREKDNEGMNHQRISIIEEISNTNNYEIPHNKLNRNDESSENFQISFNEKCDKFDVHKDDVINKNIGSSNYLHMYKVKYYENDDLIDPKKDILENVYEKNILSSQDLDIRNSKYRTFSNGNKNSNNKPKPESGDEKLSDGKASSSINNREENSNILNHSKGDSSNNILNNSSIENKQEQNQKVKKHSSIKDLGSKGLLIRSNTKSYSDFYSFFDCNVNPMTTNSNNDSKVNYNQTSSNLRSSKKNDTILAQSDSDEYKKRIHSLSDDEVSYASENSITNHTVVKNAKPKELKMGMINDILVMLIFFNLGFLSSSFLVFNSKSLNKDNTMCETQGLIQNYFDLGSICWTTVVSNVMKNMIFSINIDSEMKKFKWYLSYCLLMPLVFSIGPIFTDSYGPSGPWCWIQSSCGNHQSILSKEDIWIYIMYTFMWVHILIICSHFYKTIKYFSKRLREIRNQNREDEKKFIKKNKLILYCFPIILILSKTPATINRGMFILFSFESVVLFHLQAAFSPLIGILNSFVFIHIHAAFFKEKKIKRINNLKEVMGRSSDL